MTAAKRILGFEAGDILTGRKGNGFINLYSSKVKFKVLEIYPSKGLADPESTFKLKIKYIHMPDEIKEMFSSDRLAEILNEDGYIFDSSWTVEETKRIFELVNEVKYIEMEW